MVRRVYQIRVDSDILGVPTQITSDGSHTHGEICFSFRVKKTTAGENGTRILSSASSLGPAYSEV